MPSDPSIIGELRPPAFNSPFQSLGQIYALRGAQQEQQLRQAQIANEQELTRRTKHENDLAQAAGQAQQYTDAFRQHFADPQTGIVPEDKMPALDAFLDQHGLSATKAQMRAAVMDSNKAIEEHQQYLADQKAQAFDSVRDLPPDQAVTILGNRFKALGLPDQERFAAIAKMADMRPDQGKQAIQAAVQASPTTQKAVTDRAHSEAEAASARALAEDRNRPPVAPQPTPQTFMIDGRPVRGSFIPTPDGGRYMFNGQDVTAKAQPIPARATTAVNVGSNDPESTKYWADQVSADPSQWSMLASNKPLQNAVQVELAKRGVPITKLTQQSRQMSETAKEILPHIDTIEKEWENLNKLGLTGPVSNRWADFVANKVGAGELAGGNPANAAALGKFKTDVGLMMTAVARAHGGARGGGSPAMLAHMQDLMDSVGKDFPTFKGNLEGVRDWMQGYANMSPGTMPGTAPASSSDAVVPPAGAKILRYNAATGKFE